MGFGPPPQITLPISLDGEALFATMEQPDGMAACSWAAEDDWSALFPGALPHEQNAYWMNRLRDPYDPLSDDAIRMVAYGAAEQVYAVSWWAARALCRSATDNWLNFSSWAVGVGFNPQGETAARIVAACWAWRCAILDHDSPAAFTLLEREIFTPPPGFDIPGQQHQEQKLTSNRAMFDGLMGGR